uniref:Uncharacterized protein n=1 Tax=Cucumis sativus TaxID=3659 RepID=A0A0A0LDE9_CUCSA
MELQAVPPSVLHPPMSEKAIRARKKYTRQEEVRAIELRNSSKLVGLNLNFKLRSHKYFQKLGRRRVQDFFESSEDRAEWHRVRSAVFLNVGHLKSLTLNPACSRSGQRLFCKPCKV